MRTNHRISALIGTAFIAGTIGISLAVSPADAAKEHANETAQQQTMLRGTLYDLKQTQDGTDTEMTQERSMIIMQEFLQNGWDESTFSDYYQSPTKLYASYFFSPREGSERAPVEYQCADKVKPAHWCAVFKGTVRAPRTSEFRFVGAADDVLVIRFNGEVVFDHGWSHPTIGMTDPNPAMVNGMLGLDNNDGFLERFKNAGVMIPPVLMYKYSTTPHWNTHFGGFAAGKPFSVVAGETYTIEILLNDKGTEVGVNLMIEDMEYQSVQKDTENGTPIFHLFRTNSDTPDDSKLKGKECAPYNLNDTIWEVVQD